MAPVAKELSSVASVLEPLQVAPSLEGQVRELHRALETHGSFPVTLIGWSWGAMLGFIYTAQHPSLVRKLVLVASGVFDSSYAGEIMKTRLERLSDSHKAEAISLMDALEAGLADDRTAALARFGALMTEADCYDQLPQSEGEAEKIEVSYEVYRCVWGQAEELRSSGKLLAMGKKIRCPVVAIHGDYDPHPAQGIRDPLSRVVKDFRLVLLEKCGHCPWSERSARQEFFRVLKREILWSPRSQS
ncbi:MAG: alpha/beta hydrolase [Dehalococcoidia bacterium]|nr:alpha/beta hydrolase [Dehalococcoidia bacterium]